MKADKESIKAIVKMPDIMELYGLRSQRNKKYICPFHSEKTPSMSIKNNYFHCFGCGRDGDIFTFIQHMNNCGFPAALDFICKQFNIPNDGKPDFEFNKLIQERQKAAQAREMAKEYEWYTYVRLIAYRQYLKGQEQSGMVVNHIAWCDRLIDRMIDGEEMNMDIDVRLGGMCQQIKAGANIECFGIGRGGDPGPINTGQAV